MPNINYVGNGRVVLIAGGGKVYTDVAARFVRSERDLDSILASPHDKKLVQNILKSGHLAATEFDWFIFGVEGYSRVAEVQLVRKRMASYLIKSGRQELNGKRAFDVVLPRTIAGHYITTTIQTTSGEEAEVEISPYLLLQLLEEWYEKGVEKGLPEEDLRYMKPQATAFRAMIGMNIHALRDWWKIRLCRNAQKEIRHMAAQMFLLVRKAAPELAEGAGPSCEVLGYCPENNRQNPRCKGRIYTQEEAMRILNEHRNGGY